MGLTVTLAGQDITAYVDEHSIDIQDTWGQGPGVGQGSTGRAATATLIVSLGPISKAYGAGQTLPNSGGPFLVRQGEIIITDSSGNRVYAGYVSKMDDKTPRHQKVMYTELEAVDYWQHLDRVNIQSQVYDGQTDIQVITSVIQTYAPWISLQFLPTAPSYTFGPLNFQNKSVQYALQHVADVTGYAIWIDDYKNVFYANPYQSPTAPFALSDTPDFQYTFPHKITDYSTDDNSAINRVTFYGGKNLTNDFWQDLSPQANGSNSLFTLAYYPHKCSDGKYHVQQVSGTDLVVGFDGSTGAKNTLIQNGGTAQCLINIDNHTIVYDSSVIPTAANHPQVKYRREKQMVVVVTDSSSFQFFGQWLDGTISDTTVFDNASAVTRCRTILSEQSMGLTTFKAVFRRPGLHAGMVVNITNGLQGMDSAYLVQEVQIKPLGAGNFEYTAHCGAWNWNIIDVLKQSVMAGTADDSSANDSLVTVVVEQLNAPAHTHITMSTQTRAMSQYYFRTTALNDGHDFKFGLSSF